ncbi:LOW QUALITY PROTEIN: testis-expressed protein 48 [Manis pentadactyla]|uniref:LOW QUALITY PROTEIN: testis-expressed protein 48 n=1 Tax=Manis pentadactyla TaxID=143292 RepID=UPI00255CD4D9|nr:LOW QUALITY PROTEIN: testis-expressed protein 48 [Manis pentadactyla]
MGSYRRPRRGESFYTWEQASPIQPPSQKLPKDNWNSSPRTRGIPLPPTTVHQSLASKIFCSCCRDCKDPQAMGDSKNPSQTQEHQPSTGSRYQMRTPCLASPDLIYFSTIGLQKDELGRHNSEHTNAASRLPSGQPLMHPEKTASSPSGNELEDLNTYASQRGFYKRNLNCYSQNHWPFQPCLFRRP